MKEELVECFQHVRNSQNSALAHYQIWFTLRGKGKAIDEYLDDMNDYRYVDFFHAANSGNYKLMFIETSCLFDSDDRTHNIRSLKSAMIENGLTELADRFDQELKPFTKLVSNMKTIRSRIIAHKEAYVEPSELYKEHGIKPNEIRDLLNTTAGLLMDLESILTDNSSGHSVGPTDRWEQATFKLLDALRTERSL
jgi:hypothetical protein